MVLHYRSIVKILNECVIMNVLLIVVREALGILQKFVNGRLLFQTFCCTPLTLL